MFHYALQPGGFLFLGQSETIGRFTDLFTPLDKTKCVYQAVDAARPRGMPLSISGRRPDFSPSPRPIEPIPGTVRGFATLVEARIALFTPPHVVVTGDGEIVYSARTGKYLELPPGGPTRQLPRWRTRTSVSTCAAPCAGFADRSNGGAREHPIRNRGSSLERVSLVVEPMPERDAARRSF